MIPASESDPAPTRTEVADLPSWERHLDVGPRMRARFHEPRGFLTWNSDTRPLITTITDAVQVLAQTIGENVPEGRQQESALVALEEVHMRAMRAFEDDVNGVQQRCNFGASVGDLGGCILPRGHHSLRKHRDAEGKAF